MFFGFTNGEIIGLTRKDSKIAVLSCYKEIEGQKKMFYAG